VDDPSIIAPPPVRYNVTWAIEEMVHSLKQVTSKQKSPPNVNPQLAESFNLRLLIHYVGDIHQPLHAINRYDEVFKGGDEGGNYFSIEEVAGVTNLHMLWDSVLTAFDVDLQQPLSEFDFLFLTEHATRIRTAYPPESLSGLFEVPRTQWYEEGM
jgi:hypothetical protein